MVLKQAGKTGIQGEIWRSLDEVPAKISQAVVAVGNFDGVHLGHQALLKKMIDFATENQIASRVVTFNPHPRHIFTGRQKVPLITSYKTRNELLLSLGLDAVLDIEFTKEFADNTPRDFVRKVLVDKLNATAVVMGNDSRFGRANEGDIHTMVKLGKEFGFTVINVADLMQDSCNTEKISSTAIRKKILNGAVDEAALMLGRYHSLSDVVQHGFKRGRELGFPTANFSSEPNGLIPEDGIYAGYFTVLDFAQSEIAGPEARNCVTRQPATISIGTNPTFEDGPAERIVETYVLGSHDYNFYGRQVKLEFVKKLRDTIAFDGVEALIEQMHQDVAVTSDTLSRVSTPKDSAA